MFFSQIFSVSKCCDIQGSHLIGYLWVFWLMTHQNVWFVTSLQLNLFCTELPENYIYLNQLELSIFSCSWAEITSMISDQNCTTWGSITIPVHPFWNRPKYRTWLVQIFCWCSTDLVWSIYSFWGEKNKSFGNKICKICTWYSLSFIFLQFDWLL